MHQVTVYLNDRVWEWLQRQERRQVAVNAGLEAHIDAEEGTAVDRAAALEVAGLVEAVADIPRAIRELKRSAAGDLKAS